MVLTQVVSGNRILAADLNQFYNLLKGVAASGESVTLIYNATALIFQPSADPAAGTRVLDIKNNAGTHLMSLDYNGVLELLAAAAAPSGAVAGAVYFDTLLSALRIHDGTNWRDIAGGSSGPLPNLVLNSDFSRRTVFGLAMPEVFADLSGTTKIDGGAAGAVAANIFTQGAANNEYAWCAGSFVWRDGMASATFKATAIAGIYSIRWRVSATEYIVVTQNNGSFYIRKVIAGAGEATVVTVANVLTINRWYWIELGKQGTTITARIYDTGGTTPGVTKASSTLITAANLNTTVADASVQVGASISITSDQAAAQWGGIATGNGGVYVETWLPESYVTTFGGTLGGQAIGFDESTDAGPLGKQWAVRGYIPAASRTINITSGTQANVSPSLAYTYSLYLKVSGKGGSGALAYSEWSTRDQAGGSSSTLWSATDAGETSWTRKTSTATSASTARQQIGVLYVNPSSTATGTAYFMLPQLEAGSVATAWRNAPADDAPIVWTFSSSRDDALAADGEVNARDLAGNLFVPWDATLVLAAQGTWVNSGANTDYLGATVAAAQIGQFIATNTGATVVSFAVAAGTGSSAKVSAGKTRVALTAARAAGTVTFEGATYSATRMTVTAFRGK